MSVRTDTTSPAAPGRSVKRSFEAWSTHTIAALLVLTAVIAFSCVQSIGVASVVARVILSTCVLTGLVFLRMSRESEEADIQSERLRLAYYIGLATWIPLGLWILVSVWTFFEELEVAINLLTVGWIPLVLNGFLTYGASAAMKTECPNCHRLYARIRTGGEILSRQDTLRTRTFTDTVRDADGTFRGTVTRDGLAPVSSLTLRADYACKFCGYSWSEIMSGEIKR